MSIYTKAATGMKKQKEGLGSAMNMLEEERAARMKAAAQAASKKKMESKPEVKKEVVVEQKKAPVDFGTKGGTGETWEQRKARIAKEAVEQLKGK